MTYKSSPIGAASLDCRLCALRVDSPGSAPCSAQRVRKPRNDWCRQAGYCTALPCALRCTRHGPSGAARPAALQLPMSSGCGRRRPVRVVADEWSFLVKRVYPSPAAVHRSGLPSLFLTCTGPSPKVAVPKPHRLTTMLLASMAVTASFPAPHFTRREVELELPRLRGQVSA